MPSPFPGMDPYLESPDVWPDFHDALTAQIRGELNRILPPAYYAQLEMRPEIGIIGDDTRRHIVPDVSVQQSRPGHSNSPGGSVAVLNGPRTDISPSLQITVASEPIRHHFVEVRAQRGRVLVTLIEIVSPSNKCPGVDRQAYQDKQQEVLGSDASLVEIDLLRSGRPVVGGPEVTEAVGRLQQRVDYVVLVGRAWRRGAQLDHQLFPLTVHDILPCIPVPLRQGEDEIPLDLQYIFNLAYDSGPYRRGAVDYTSDPAVPLVPEDRAWANELLCQGGLRA